MKPTLLALRTCSRLEGSIPSPEHETKTKSVSCPVCRIYIKIWSIINITEKNKSSRCLVKQSFMFYFLQIVGTKQNKIYKKAMQERMPYKYYSNSPVTIHETTALLE